MKNILHRKEWVRYHCVEYKDHNLFLTYDELQYLSTAHFSINKIHGNSEDIFVKNYGNLLYGLHKEKNILVVEESDEKISIKFFVSTWNRNQGTRWFKSSKNMFFVTVNRKTGDVYEGKMINYNKKRKCGKHLRRNFFLNQPGIFLNNTDKPKK